MIFEFSAQFLEGYTEKHTLSLYFEFSPQLLGGYIEKHTLKFEFPTQFLEG